MAWAHSTGLGSEIVLREEVVEVPAELRDAVSSETLHIEYVFDRQARPHLILTCGQLTGTPRS